MTASWSPSFYTASSRCTGATSSSSVIVKRVIGLPGDGVQLKDGVVYVSGRRISENGYTIRPDFGNYGPISVPAREFFVLGDNRNNSEDSRFFGYVPRGNIVGKAVFIYWPLQRIGFVH